MPSNLKEFFGQSTKLATPHSIEHCRIADSMAFSS